MSETCITCGGKVDHQPDVIRARERLGLRGGPRRCSKCTWAALVNMPSEDAPESQRAGEDGG